MCSSLDGQKSIDQVWGKVEQYWQRKELENLTKSSHMHALACSPLSGLVPTYFLWAFSVFPLSISGSLKLLQIKVDLRTQKEWSDTVLMKGTKVLSPPD